MGSWLLLFTPIQASQKNWLVTWKISGRTLAKRSALLQVNTNNIHEPWCTSTKSERKKYLQQTNCNKPSSGITEDDWNDSPYTLYRLRLHIQALYSEQLDPALSVHLTTLLPQKCWGKRGETVQQYKQGSINHKEAGQFCLLRDHPEKPEPPSGKQCMYYTSEAVTLVPHIQSKAQDGQFSTILYSREILRFSGFFLKKPHDKNNKKRAILASANLMHWSPS